MVVLYSFQPKLSSLIQGSHCEEFVQLKDTDSTASKLCFGCSTKQSCEHLALFHAPDLRWDEAEQALNRVGEKI